MKRSIPFAVLVLSGLFAAMPAVGQSLEFPASWEGEWEFTDVMRVCGNSTIVGTEVDTSGICAMDTFDPGDEGVGSYVCTGNITDTTIDVDCSFTIDFNPELDCAAEYSFVINGTKSGDTVSGTETFSITYTGSGCGILTDSCEESTLTGVRLSTTPSGCITPVEPVSWGSIKALYE